MNKLEELHDIPFDEFDEVYFPRRETCDFDDVVESAISRRGFLGGVLTMSTAAFLAGTSALTPTLASAAGRFGFKAIDANDLDTVTVPEGFEWHVAAKWGDPLWSDSPDFDQATRGNAESQSRAFGDNNDGMSVFASHGKHILVANNEYTNRKIIWGNREEGKATNDDDINKGKMAHGVTIAEIAVVDGKWGVVKEAPLNRRITPDTSMEITGPAKGHELMKTAADPQGEMSLGTWNNCGNGRTPWGTYLACEENFNGYFSSSNDSFEPTAEMKRYGIGKKDWGYGWASVDDRFDISKHPNECNRAGYIVEIDPFDPTSTPKKRTALGRMKHENAEVVISASGNIVVYMGDDERGEFLYKFVSNGKFSLGGDNSDLLQDGKLYAAKFSDDQRGEWIELTPASTGMPSMAEICIHTRQAASTVGATTMDRPEWVAANPKKVEAYCALTNNKNRGIKTNKGGDPTPLGGPNPREANKYGQIVRWVPDGGDHASKGFDWDLFVLAGNPNVHSDERAGSTNVHAGNLFNSPDGIIFDRHGFLWIQTDGNYSNKGDFEGMGNNQMLVGDTQTGAIQRFLVGPNECEVTGAAWSADFRTLFVGIQHPGERGNSHFPDGGDTVPRSCVIAVNRQDGKPIG